MGYSFHWNVLFEYRGLLLEGLVQLCTGVGPACLPPSLRGLGPSYVEFFRNIPPIVQFFFWYFAAGLEVFPAALIGLSVFTAAYIAEIVRSGIGAIPRTQIEAARSSGMNQWQIGRASCRERVE